MATTYTRSADRNLKSEGYNFFPSSLRPELLTVAKPNNEGTYTVDVVRGTCTCAAGKRGVKCCHLREARAYAVKANVESAVARYQPDRAAFEKMKAADFD